MANERPMGLRNDQKVIDENWKKIDWGNHSMEEKLNLEEFRVLYEVPYNDGDNTLAFGIYKGDHHFLLRDTRNDKDEVVKCSSLTISETLLGLMNEIKKYEILGLSNATN